MEENKNNSQNQNEELNEDSLDSVSGGAGININVYDGGPKRRSHDDFGVNYGRRPRFGRGPGYGPGPGPGYGRGRGPGYGYGPYR